MSDPDFLPWLEERERTREAVDLVEIIEQAGGVDAVGVVVVDLVEGFCREGPLASPRVSAIVEPICEFLQKAAEEGVTNFFMPCDCHPPDSPEFTAFPPHCVAGSPESELVSELQKHEYAHLFRRLDKRSVSSLIGTGLAPMLEEQGLKTIVCVGDCTDLCLYHLAVGLRFWANDRGLSWDVVVVQDQVATYDLPTTTARELGILPHPADLLSKIFFYHLELNGVRVVSKIR